MSCSGKSALLVVLIGCGAAVSGAHAEAPPVVGEPRVFVFASPGGVDLKAYVFSSLLVGAGGRTVTVRVTDGAVGYDPLADRDVLLCEPHSSKCSASATTDKQGLARFTGVKNDLIRVSLFPDQDGGRIVDLTQIDVSKPIELIAPPSGTLRLIVEEQTPTGTKNVQLQEFQLVMWRSKAAGIGRPFSYGKVVLHPSGDHYDAAVPADEAIDLELHLDGFNLVSSKGVKVPANVTKQLRLLATRKDQKK